MNYCAVDENGSISKLNNGITFLNVVNPDSTLDVMHCCNLSKFIGLLSGEGKKC